MIERVIWLLDTMCYSCCENGIGQDVCKKPAVSHKAVRSSVILLAKSLAPSTSIFNYKKQCSRFLQ